MSLTYMIIENGKNGLQPMDGDFYHDEESLFKALPYADAGARVIVADFDKPPHLFDLTMELVRQAYSEGAFVGHEERCRNGLAGEYITFPPSRSEEAATRADERRQLRAEGAL